MIGSLRSLAKLASLFTLGIGLIVLLGWGLSWEGVKGLLPGLPTMKANTALGFVLGGLSLWSYGQSKPPNVTSRAGRHRPQLWAWLSVGSAAIVLSLGSLAVVEYSTGFPNLNINEWLFPDTSTQVDTATPGLMSVSTAWTFILLSIAILCLHGWQYSWAQTSAIFGFLLSLLSFLGFILQITDLRLFAGTSMALHTSFTFLVWALGILLAQPQQGWMQEFTCDYLGGKVARPLLIAVIGMPILLGSVALEMYRLDWLSVEVGIVVRTLPNMLVLGGVTLWNARYLNRLDIEQRRVHRELHRVNRQLQEFATELEAGVQERTQALADQTELLQTVMDNIPIMLSVFDAAGNFQWVNREWESFIGCTLAEAQTRNIMAEIYPDARYRQYVSNTIQLADEVWRPFRLQRLTGEVADTAWINVQLSTGGSIGIGRDLSAEYQLQAEQERLIAILEASPDGIGIADEAGRTLWLNPAFFQLLGLDPAMNIYDLPIAVCHPQWALDIVLQVGIPTAIAQGNWQGETALLRSDGTEVPISQVIVVHRDADNNIAYLSTVVRDISHIKRMEAELRDREQQFRNMADYAPVMIWKCDAEQQCDYLSQSWYAFTGFAPGTGLGQAWLDSVHPDDRAQLWDKERAAQLDQQPFRLEYRLRHHTGEYRWVIDAARPWRGVDGEFKGYIGSIIDISDRKRIEAELRDSEQQFRTMADYAPMMVWKCDQHGACNYLSQSWYAFTGLETPFGLGKTWINAIHPEERDRICQTVQVAHTAQSSFRMEYRLRHHTGDYRWVMDAARPWLGSNGEFKGYIGSIIDISDLKQTEADLRLSEERYRSLTSILTSIVWTTDAEGAFITPQIEWQAYTGQRWETAQGFGWAAALHPDDRDQVVAAWLAAKEQLTAYQAEGRIWHAASQSYHYFEARAVPLFHANGTVREWVGNVTDCHEIKLAEAARLQSEANLRSVLENMPVMLDAFDESGNITVWNQECERVTGYSAADMIGNPHAMQLLYPDRDYLATMQQQWAAVGNDYRNWEWHLVAKNGEIKTVAWSNISDRFPISDWGIWGVGVDVTERQRAKQEIIALNQSLEERVEQRTAELLAANQELEAFSYSVSHDLRAPLRSISGFSEILQEDYATQLDEEGLRYLDRIQQGAQRMSELINDLLMLSRITRSELMHTRVNLSEMTREICQTLHNTHQNRRVNWCVDSQVQAIGDQRLLRIALENLLSNAWKFTVHQPEARIEFGTLLEDQAEQPVYFIRDNGVGFDMSYANKLFTAFQRLHSDQEFSGTGIGLAIVQRVIHRHGGRVWAEAAPNAGATFYFSLPSAQSSAPAQ